MKDIIFTDGEILSYIERDDSLILQFQDYQGIQLQIRFLGNVEFENNDGVRCEFADSKLLYKSEQWELKLLDSDYTCLFKVNFDESEVKFLESK